MGKSKIYECPHCGEQCASDGDVAYHAFPHWYGALHMIHRGDREHIHNEISDMAHEARKALRSAKGRETLAHLCATRNGAKSPQVPDYGHADAMLATLREIEEVKNG